MRKLWTNTLGIHNLRPGDDICIFGINQQRKGVHLKYAHALRIQFWVGTVKPIIKFFLAMAVADKIKTKQWLHF